MSQALISTSRLDAPSAAIAASAVLVQDDAAGVVHDLGNLIQIASSALNIIARSPRLGTGALEPVIARAKTSLERAGALVHQTMGRVGARTATVTVLSEQVSLSEALDEIGSLLTSLCEPHVALAIHVERGLPDLNCCRLDLQNAILNLVLNARDAMSEVGAITIRAHGLGPSAAPLGVLLRVVDNGAGMSPSTIQRAFDPFFTTKGERGSGMGLAMVRRFAEAAGGSVSIDSQLGAGATVSIRLPGASEQDWAQALPPRRQEASQPPAG